jgi:lipopolysaccharide transport system ATP-binding protein
MSDTIIKVEDLSKQYRLGEIGTGSLSHDLNRWWHSIRGKDDPYLKIGEQNDRSKKSESDYVWALRDINFEIKKGETWGVVGKNGAGKSTLLKLLSRVTAPTTGSIKYKGKMASLLEVGTGFHGELTGKENIFLNGAILGMRKHEIQSKLDEIIEFAGIEKYIDTPVKRYSSGMYVRLAFAVAAHLDTDILILDEVLAVGDASFQRKCLGKMNDAAVNQGKTVLFVSHNLSQVQGLCKKGLFLENGGLKSTGDIQKIISEYTFGENNGSVIDLTKFNKALDQHNLKFKKLVILNNLAMLKEGDALKLSLDFMVDIPLKSVQIFTSLKDSNGSVLVEVQSTATYPNLNIDNTGMHTISVEIPLTLRNGSYILSVGAKGHGLLVYIPDVANIDILPKNEELLDFELPSKGALITPSVWKI